jgi:hypothetical protein
VRKGDGNLVTQREFTSTPWRWRVFDAEVLRRHQAIVIENTPEEVLEVVKEVEALADDLHQGQNMACREPALIEKWRRCLEFEHFYGNARPGLHYLQSKEREFLGDDGIDEANPEVPLADQLKWAAA